MFTKLGTRNINSIQVYSLAVLLDSFQSRTVFEKQASIVIGNFCKDFVLIGCDAVLLYITMCLMGCGAVSYGT
jgi:hypothetical protein